MSTWQIFSDADNNFRWENTEQQPHVKGQPPGVPIPALESTPLPSMADLLLQGFSQLTEDTEGHNQNPPSFRSGLGKSVAVKQSSIAKALSILGDVDEGFADIGQFCNGGDDQCSSFPNSLFQTGSGKKVNLSSTGLLRAKTLLGLEEHSDHHTSQDFNYLKNQPKSDELSGWKNSSHLVTKEGVSIVHDKSATPLFKSKTSSIESDAKREAIPHLVHSDSKCPPIKFHTAGGRSISVSSDALQRAKSLLGDLELGAFSNEGDVNDSDFSFSKQRIMEDKYFNKENNQFSTFPLEIAKSKHVSKSFLSPLRSDSKCMQPAFTSENVSLGCNLIKKFDAEDFDNNCKISSDGICQQKGPSSMSPSHGVMNNSLEAGISSRMNLQGHSLGGPLVDISNKTGLIHIGHKLTSAEKRRLGRSSISPFKRPRSSRFVTPLNNSTPAPIGLSTLASEKSSHGRKVSTHYPFHIQRAYLKEYFEVPPFHLNMVYLEQLPDHIRRMNPENAAKYMFCAGSGELCIGAEAFYHMLVQSGASLQHTSKEWVANHYKWIVWKLACYDRCYPAKSSGKLLTVKNVLEELKYRYEKEVNHGHRSAIKRILEGDQPPSSMLVLCISSIHPNSGLITETPSMVSNGAEEGTNARVELTDGWYAVNALLDVTLSKKLAIGKLFVGQKLRIWGAGLCGWAGPVSPLEAPNTVSLLLHINGTYRAHWADRLGLCKGGGAPLAFRCIKSTGGPVPSTLVGVTRIYPVLYRERLSTGGFIVRTEKMEAKMMQLHSQRRSLIAEGIMAEFQRGTRKCQTNIDSDCEEGAKILKILETAAEPEVLMAEMTSEQLNSFATYKAKLEAIRESNLQQSIEKALEDAGLSAREVTPFMRVRVVGLSRKNYITKSCPRKGLVTIWNPTEKQKLDLAEGKAYAVAGLMPLSSDSDTLFLQARGSTTKWVPLSLTATEYFESFFSPRKSVQLSELGEVPLSSEFDIAAMVVYVGEVYVDAHRKKQWVFVADGSISASNSEEPLNSLLAISFCSLDIDCDSFAPVNHNLVGSLVSFCNLSKRAKDQVNHLWVAEATENSTYFITYDYAHCSYLKEAAASVERWAKTSSLTIEKLRHKVLSIIGNDEAVK